MIFILFNTFSGSNTASIFKFLRIDAAYEGEQKEIKKMFFSCVGLWSCI
jgi:hypothetical protein